MYTVMVVSIIIVIVVLLLAVITTSKAYTYKHSIDSLDDNPYLNQEKNQHDSGQDQKNA